MLLEVLSDFQISIPELGVVEAPSMPLVLLTSNDSRELTEALKRRCLYLWLDYPDVEREVEIVRLHAPELDEALARRLVEVVGMVRELDLKKPPSIAESIDWARALLLLGADQIDAEIFQRTMSIIVKHRTDLDLVAERVGMRLRGRAARRRRRERTRWQARHGSGGPAAIAPQLVSFMRGAPLGGRRGRHRRDPRRVRGASRTSPGPSARTSARRWRRPWRSRRRTGGCSSSSSIAGSSAPPSSRPSTPRRRRRRERRRLGGRRSRRRALRPRRAARDDPASDRRGLRRADARPRAARGRRLRPPRRGVGRRRRRRPADPPLARADAGLDRGPTAPGEDVELDRDGVRRFEAHLRRELERGLIERTGKLPPVAAAGRARPGAADEPDPGPRGRAPLGDAAEAAPGDARQRAARAPPRARVVDVRRTMRTSLETGGVPLRLRYRPKRPRRPEIYVLCDVSTSVTSASVFFLSVLHALHDSFRKLRSFVFIERISEVTDVVRARARLPQDQRADQPRRRRRRRLRLHRLRPGLARVPRARSPPTSIPARP